MNEKKLLTVVTPTYNRAKMLLNLYESLEKQTSNNFIWLIIDDGSTDNSKEIIKSFISKDKVRIKYHYQTNAGKYVAHNTGVNMCTTELFLCVDSDDILFPEAVEIIENTWQIIKNDVHLAGIVSPKEMDGFSFFKNPPRTGRLMDLYNSGALVGETALVFRSSILKGNLFPVIENEKFMSESILYNLIDQKYELYILNKFIYRAEYCDNGLTRNIRKIHWENPRSTLLMYKSNAAYESNFIKAIKSYGSYLAWKRNRNIRDVFVHWKVPFRVKIFGVLLYAHYAKLFRKQEKELY